MNFFARTHSFISKSNLCKSASPFSPESQFQSHLYKPLNPDALLFVQQCSNIFVWTQFVNLHLSRLNSYPFFPVFYLSSWYLKIKKPALILHCQLLEKEEKERKKWKKARYIKGQSQYFFLKNHGCHRPLEQYFEEVQHERKNESGIRISHLIRLVSLKQWSPRGRNLTCRHQLYLTEFMHPAVFYIHHCYYHHSTAQGKKKSYCRLLKVKMA